MCGCPLYCGGESSQVAPTDEGESSQVAPADEGYESILAQQLEDVLRMGEVDEEEDGWEKEGEGVKFQDEASS
jgi:hypothetical protein